jgi:hypothetical protein
LTYQWYSNSSSSNTGGTSLGSANGAQTDTYSPPSTAGTTYYYAVVSNGSCAVPGSVFQVNVGSTFDMLGAGSSLPIASAGYSFRKLGSCYSGPLGRFRIGSSYYDVYADGNNSLSLSSPVSTALGSVTAGVSAATGTLLSSLVSSTTAGYVGVWYDQSGNTRNATQATALSQPIIVSAGVIIRTSGNIVAVDCNGKQMSNTQPNTTTQATFTAQEVSSTGNSSAFLLPFSTININTFFSVASNGNLTLPHQGVGTPIFFVNNNSITATRDSLFDNTAVNNETLLSVIGGGSTTSNRFLQYTPAGFNGNYKTFEVIVYNTDQASNRTGINTAINSFYNIF